MITVNAEAYKTDSGPTLLLAGPGTGKTYQIAKRIQYLTSEKNISPDEITVITFTTEAAASMRSKIAEEGPEYIEADKRPGRISTMHSLGFAIISENPSLVGLRSNINIVDDQELRKILMKDAALRVKLSITDGERAYNERASATTSTVSKQVISEYEKILRCCNAVDYDDQITLACNILKKDEEIRKKYTAKSKHLLIDEYQDINKDQYELIRLLCSDNITGLFVVGDDDQSIYGFRGGSPDFIRNFQKDFATNSLVFKMEVSRRCLKNILDSAISVVTNFDKQRIDKGAYQYLKTDTGAVIVHNCPSDDREAEIIASIIHNTVERAKKEGKQEGDFFVLVQNRLYGEKIHAILQLYGIKSDLRSESNKDGFRKVHFLKRWLLNKQSSSLTRLITQFIIDGGTTSLPNSKARSTQNVAQRQKGMGCIAALWDSVISNSDCFYDALGTQSKSDPFINDIFQKLNELSKSYEDKNIAAFLQKVASYVKPWPNPNSFLEEVERIFFVKNKRQVSMDNIIRILTFESAKGLEADYVFIVGLEEGNIPRGHDEQKVAEEARKLFVAMTRAKEELHLFNSRKRTGAITLHPQSHNLTPSRFLDCLPSDQTVKQYHPPKNKLKNKGVD